MEVERFPAGTHVKNGAYRCFVPPFVNREWTWKTPEINLLLEKSAHKLGELSAFSRLSPDADSFVLLRAGGEAVLSSRIEGTKTELDEALKPEAEINPERLPDWREVQNYIAALEEAEKSALPVSSRLIKKAHKTLMRGVRGQNKAPGEYRKIQNFLGASAAKAVFTPPPAVKINALMGDLEKFLHNEKIPALVRIAAGHYQFETIHPFLDGNGRIGRLLVPLFLARAGMIDKPLYMSRYLEKNKAAYYRRLTNAREKNDMAGWLKFFLRGAAESAEDALRALSAAQKLKEKTTAAVHKNFRASGNPLTLLEHLFRRPIIGADDAAEVCGITYAAGLRLAGKMVRAKILRETPGRRRRLFVFDSYLDIFR